MPAGWKQVGVHTSYERGIHRPLISYAQPAPVLTHAGQPRSTRTGRGTHRPCATGCLEGRPAPWCCHACTRSWLPPCYSAQLAAVSMHRPPRGTPVHPTLATITIGTVQPRSGCSEKQDNARQPPMPTLFRRVCMQPCFSRAAHLGATPDIGRRAPPLCANERPFGWGGRSGCHASGHAVLWRSKNLQAMDA